MVKLCEPPTMQADAFEGWLIRWQSPAKSGSAYQKRGITTFSEKQAKDLFARHSALRIIYPLINYAKQQERIIAVMQLGNAMRKAPLGKMHKLCRALAANELLTPLEAAEKLRHDVMPLFVACMPGKTSRYFEYAKELGKVVCDFIRQYERQPATTIN